MLVDAIRAEGFRLSKNKTALFWSLLFVPIISLAIGAVTNFVLKGSETKILGDEKMPAELKAALGRGTLDMADALVTAAGNLANPLVLLFVLIGAATLYAGDYRWETWRLISARNSRLNLIQALIQAIHAGADEALMLDPRGFVASCNSTNFFIRRLTRMRKPKF